MDERIVVPKETNYAGDWRRLLREWLELIHKYSSTPDDVPYWYGERALTGLLASAAWRLEDGWALEEITGVRGGEGEEGSGKPDLWLGLGKAKFTIEAKVHWPEKDVASAIQGIKVKLEEAKKQLQQIVAEYQNGNPYSVCYVVPWPRGEGIQSDLREANALLEQVAEKFASEKCVVAKYTFTSSPPVDAGRVYPGVVLVARKENWEG
ncbi:MAG: hypothetical protein GTO24_11155 [candidate division Zixibacteria bacterium]|nr:hypothetical protein [candidate division Zixibacteria bacterium]